MIRKAMYAGTWYPSSKKEIEKYIVQGKAVTRATAVFCPHAGWIYSGKVAGEVFSSVRPAGLYILIGPNHRGIGAPVGVFPEGAWETPLGPLEIEKSVAASIIEKSARRGGRPDAASHSQEHSLEVQLPFIKYFSPDARIVPISLSDYSAGTCAALGDAIAASVRESEFNGNTLLVASTDMSHYVEASYAKKIDALAIKKILELDPEGLMKTVAEHGITMCGSGPAAAILRAAKILGAKTSKLVRYATSGDTTGDNSEVVGYAGIIVD
jgi:AmmeMemoRadiSam system protein B